MSLIFGFYCLIWTILLEGSMITEHTSWIIYFFLYQIYINLNWTKTHWTETSNCWTTTGRWLTWRRCSLTLITPTGLILILSFCVRLLWPLALTGRCSGADRCPYVWVPDESTGVKTATTVCLDPTLTPGAWAAVMEGVTLRGTTTERRPFFPPLCATEQQFMSTLLITVCPSTRCPPTVWSTSTPSAPRSLILFILALPSSPLVPPCLCGQNKCLLLGHIHKIRPTCCLEGLSLSSSAAWHVLFQNFYSIVACWVCSLQDSDPQCL